MKKRLLSIAALVMTLLFIITGCSKDPVALFTKSIEKTAAIDKSSQTVDFELKLDLGEIEKPQDEFEAQMQAQLAALFSNINGSFNVKYDRTSQAMVGDGNIGLGGVSLNVKMFMKDKKLAMQVPMFPKYLTMDMAKYEELSKKDSKAEKELASKLLDTLKKTLNKDKITLADGKKINLGSGDVDTTELTVKLSSDDVKNVLTQVMDIIYTNETTRSYIIDNLKKQPEMQGLSDGDISRKLDEELAKSKEELKNVEFKDFVYTANIDKNSYIVQEKFSVAVNNLSEEAKGGSSTINMTLKRTDIGKDINFEMPNLDSNNSINIEDLEGQEGLLQPNM